MFHIFTQKKVHVPYLFVEHMHIGVDRVPSYLCDNVQQLKAISPINYEILMA